MVVEPLRNFHVASTPPPPHPKRTSNSSQLINPAKFIKSPVTDETKVRIFAVGKFHLSSGALGPIMTFRQVSSLPLPLVFRTTRLSFPSSKHGKQIVRGS
jgi:hypothetical protein